MLQVPALLPVGKHQSTMFDRVVTNIRSKIPIPRRPRILRKRSIHPSWSKAGIAFPIATTKNLDDIKNNVNDRKSATHSISRSVAAEDGLPIKPRIVVLGCGWGAYSFLYSLKRKHYDIIVVSPRNHFLFTPLLTSTTVGTLEYRCITEPIRSLSNLMYFQGKCIDIDSNNNEITVCDSVDYISNGNNNNNNEIVGENGSNGNGNGNGNINNRLYNIKYDALVYGVGSQANDFNIEGVKEHCLFLKQVKHAMMVREKIQELFESASKPCVTREERKKLLSIVIVGGGPTSIEFAAELHDWLIKDCLNMFPTLLDQVTITLVEATNKILPGFSKELTEYTTRTFAKRKIRLLLNNRVIEVTKDNVILSDDNNNIDELNYGMVVWATGNAPVELTSKLNWDKSNSGRIIIDDNLNIKHNNNICKNIFAIGDCAQHIEKPLPPTAQCAKQQGFYLASIFNDLLTKECANFHSNFLNYSDEYNRTFTYSHRGMMAYIGGYKGIVSMSNEMDTSHDLNNNGNSGRKKNSAFKQKWLKLSGLQAWLFWRSAFYHVEINSQPNLCANVLV